MQLVFQKVIIHNFLSYGHAEIILNNKNYCLVRGINKNPIDNAVSNGAGKSSWTSAICWCLTGETVNGLTSNVKNINIDEDSCWVALDFLADGQHFCITRYKNPKSDLKILLNDNDISGKGIRESEQILAKYLPDLTGQLISSIIILGQGLPNKFTANTPSGRKEVLEKLSKSDFMIQDLKERITKRAEELSAELRDAEDTLLRKNTEKNLIQQQLNVQEEIKKSFNQPQAYDQLIADLQKTQSELNNFIIKAVNEVTKAHNDANNLNDELTLESNKGRQLIEVENAHYEEQLSRIQNQYASTDADIRSLSAKIIQMKSIRDICPTCGQKIPGVLKPNTATEETQLVNLKETLSTLTSQRNAITQDHRSIIENLNRDIEQSSANLKLELKRALEKASGYDAEIHSKQTQLLESKASLEKVQLEKAHFEENKTKCLEAIQNLTITLKNLDEEILYISSNKEKLTKHLKTVNQMATLIKRDFRGYLLSNVIEYIAQRARDYSKDIFGTDKFTFALNGNNIDIAYCDKAFENLSGGEKQKADLIIQFAIRDMMQQYLGFTSNILVLDEIFDALDMIGCNNVLDLIANRLTDLESIFIISHRASELAIPYDNEFIVIKNAQGVSSIVC